MTDHRTCKCGHVEAEHYVLAEACAKCDCSEFIRLPAEALTEAMTAREIWDRTAKRPYTFSWYQGETVPAPRTWRDRLLRRHPTMIVWTRHCVVFHVAEVNVERFGGWTAILDTFLWPVIHATKDGPLWGTTIEHDDVPAESIPCAEQPRNPPDCYTQQHADRGDGAGPA